MTAKKLAIVFAVNALLPLLIIFFRAMPLACLLFGGCYCQREVSEFIIKAKWGVLKLYRANKNVLYLVLKMYYIKVY